MGSAWGLSSRRERDRVLPESLLNGTLARQQEIGRLLFLGDETATALSWPLAREARLAAPPQPVRHLWHVAEAAAVVECAAPRRGRGRVDPTVDIARGKNL